MQVTKVDGSGDGKKNVSVALTACPRCLLTLALPRKQVKEASLYLFPEVFVTIITAAVLDYLQLLPGPVRQS